jgi:protein CpxP
MSTSNNRFRNAAIAVAVVAGLATTVAAVAQPGNGPGMMGRSGPGMMMGQGAGPGMMMGGGHGRMMASNAANMSQFQQDRLGQLKSQLGITPEQQPAWDAFAAKAAEQARTMQALRQDAGTGTMPERMQQRQKAMGSMTESIGKLYEALTPKQRELFDQSNGPGHRHG